MPFEDIAEKLINPNPDLNDLKWIVYRYSTWLDNEGLVRAPGETHDHDTRTHDMLVREWLDSLNDRTSSVVAS